MEKVSTESKEESVWWHKIECHFSPKWRLPYLDQYMLDMIKETYCFELDLTILPDFMTIERLLFSAWIQVSQNAITKEACSNEAVRLVKQANEYLSNNSGKLGDGSLIGYGTIINAFLMRIYDRSGSIKEFREAETTLKELCNDESLQLDPEKLGPNSQLYVDVTHAWTLGLLGRGKICKALRLLDNALEVAKKKPVREQWLYVKAMIQGRVAREVSRLDNFQSTSHSNLLMLLEREKQTLECLVGKNKPRFDLAKAHLGTVVSADNTAKKEKIALRLIKESVAKDCDDAELALILAKLYQDLNNTGILQGVLEYIDLETDITRDNNRPVNVYFYLGLLYFKQSVLTKDTSIMDKALRMVQRVLSGDKNHIQARLWKAMILVNSQNSNLREEAKEIHSEILQEKFNSSKELYILRSISSGSFRSVYQRLQFLQNVFKFLCFCMKHHSVKDFLGNVYFESVVRNDVDERVDMLQQEVKSYVDKNTRIAAIHYLAEVNLHLENYKTAEDLFKLLKNEIPSRNELNIKAECCLAKCLYRQGKYQELRQSIFRGGGRVVEEASTVVFNEIQGLLHLAEGKEKQHEMMAKCESAIELGSLDGCLLMLTMHQHFQDKFLVVEERFAHRLAKIQLCVTKELTNSQQASNQIRKQINQEKLEDKIAEKVDAILNFSRKRPFFNENHESVHKKLRNIRHLLNEFECCLALEKNPCSTTEGFSKCLHRQCHNTKDQLTPQTNSVWSDDLSKAAENVLKKVRFLLDEVMSCLQIAVIGQKHSRSEFPILVDWKEGKQNREDATKALQTRLSQLFTGGYELYIPEVVFDSLLKIQPQFDKENEWLLLLNSTVNQMKHSGLSLGDVSKFDGRTWHRQLCTAYMVRRSCEEVEKFTTFMLQECVEMM